jgi:hypothetical protein
MKISDGDEESFLWRKREEGHPFYKAAKATSRERRID